MPNNAQKRGRTKYSLAEVEGVLARLRAMDSALTISDRDIINHYLQATINQRTRSTGPRVPAKGKRKK